MSNTSVTNIPSWWSNSNPIISGNVTLEAWEIVLFIGVGEKLDSLLGTSYKEINNKCIKFNVYIDGNSVTPIDQVLKMIKKKETFNLEVTRNGYKIYINNIKFIKIKNLIETSAKEYIEVEFDYESMDYENTLKTKEEKIAEKITMLKHRINKNDI